MKKYSIIFIILTGFCFQTKSQEISLERAESDTHIFWQSERKLTEVDFKGDGKSFEKSQVFCDSLDMCTMASIGVYAVLDIPEKKKDRGKLFEKAYFVPMFEKATSYILKESDSIGIKQQQLTFDVYELSARYARKQLEEFTNLNKNSYGMVSIMFKTIKDDAKKMRDKIVDASTHDIYIIKNDSAYYKWRSFIDEGLNSLKEYATTLEDCRRAINNGPLDKKYIESETLISLFKEDEEE